MKHLKTYKVFESNNTILSDCEDILIDLSDDGIKYDVDVTLGNDDIISIGMGTMHGYYKRVELKKYGENFERLFHYLESLGYRLDKSSYYESDSWELYERCPNCHGNNNIMVKSEVTNRKTDHLECADCGHKDHYSEFQTTEHPITKGDLMWSVKNGDKPEYIYLQFTK